MCLSEGVFTATSIPIPVWDSMAGTDLTHHSSSSPALQGSAGQLSPLQAHSKDPTRPPEVTHCRYDLMRQIFVINIVHSLAMHSVTWSKKLFRCA